MLKNCEYINIVDPQVFKRRYIDKTFTLKKLKHHTLLFDKKEFIIIIHYIISSLPMMFDHPLQTMDKDDMLGFL